MMPVIRENLPIDSDIVLLGEMYGFLLEPLKHHGLKGIIVPANPYIDKRLASHVDMSVLHAGENGIFLSQYLKGTSFEKELIDLGFIIRYPNFNQDRFYPYDCQLNICVCGDKIIFNDKTASKTVVSLLNSSHNCFIKCNQGYTKCLVSVVDENSIITSDPGIASACEKEGIDVLLIRQGYIELDGYEYGFIGGASFKSAYNKMMFTGSLDGHPDKERILKFLSDRDIEAIFLTENKIFDVGSVLPITEKQR